MAISIYENGESRAVSEGSDPKRERRYDIIHRGSGALDENLALAILKTYAPFVQIVEGAKYQRTDLRLDPVSAKKMVGTVVYEPEDKNDPDNPNSDPEEKKGPEPPDIGQLDFQVAGQSIRITQALEAKGTYAVSGVTAPSWTGAIGNDGQGNVAGCDIIAPTLSINQGAYLGLDVVTYDWVKMVAGMVGCINSTTFRAFSAGELLLTGVRGSRNVKMERWELMFNFLTSPTVNDITIGELTVSTKRGFDYLDVVYEAKEDTAGKAVVPKPIYAYVHRVYREADFNELFGSV